MLLIEENASSKGGSGKSPDVVTYSQYVHGSIFSVPNWKGNRFLFSNDYDSLTISIYGFLKSFLGASGTNQGAIDNRIEQAMDLVKSHLMNAVRSEVEELKERIVKLEDVISHLQTENDFLKANVSQEVLTQLPPPTSSHHQILQQGPQVPQSISGHTPGNNPQGGLSPTSSPLVVTTQHQQQL
ncbi:unnamed protein product [Lepeophtheirus salmonis]|uniref:(salmon louse) hypothetical protein n=1 Tax=Lepeophtheirus salmonis TaxID=72036 RepID=A0A7R8CK56_LEPSM|nr:unnamed protein product [Lepeophtheirus salmonis]CAF2847084.1 unnamed protein product [Lepeophtheirus salmonis]